MTTLIAKALAVVLASTGSIETSHWKRTPRKPKLDPPAPMQTALASWYGEDGPGACGTGAQTGLHFASLILRCGTRIRICHRGCVIATMADHGPYVAGRTFDLNVNLRNAIACSDLCTVRWRLA